MRAKVTSTTDSGAAQRFEDEHGGQWVYYTDDAAGTIAVNACDDAGSLTEGAGVFVWTKGSEDAGEIYEKAEGDFYGVNCTEEFIVDGGEWAENEALVERE